MGRGRPPKPGTEEEKAAARRERVRNNVRALRERRRKEAAVVGDIAGTSQLAVEWIDEEVTNEPSEISDELEGQKSSTASYASSSTSASRPGALFLVNRRNDTRLIFPTTVDTKSPYALALLATVREQFLPDSVYLPPAINSTNGKPWESDQFLWTPCAFWVTSAFTKASNQGTSLLKTILLSIGMLMKSLQFQDASLKVASLEMYRRCLQGIRKALEPLIEGRQERPSDTVALYLSCHAAAMFELIQNSDLSATMHHLRGVSQLIYHLGDGRDEDGQSIAWLLLQDYRLAEMGLCLKFRYTSIMSLRRRHYEALGAHKRAGRDASADGYGSHNMLVRITDMADDISAVMVQLDNIRPHLQQTDAFVKLRRTLEELGAVWTGYQHLHDEFKARYGSAFVYKDTSSDDPALGALKFKTFDIGAAWCYKLMTQIYCVETKIDATTMALEIRSDVKFEQSASSPESDELAVDSVDDIVSYEALQELRHLHRSICIQLTQCLQYFIQTDKGVTGQTLALFPLDAAVTMLDRELHRLQVDLKETESSPGTQVEMSMIEANIEHLIDTRAVCQQMQHRAEAFGLPTCYHDGSGTTNDFQPPKMLRDMGQDG